MAPARIESLRVRNFRALRDLELRDLTPLTAFVGPNGSGKSTIFDVFAFVHEAFTQSTFVAVEGRSGMRELRSRGEEGPIEIEIGYRVAKLSGLYNYHFVLDEDIEGLVIRKEVVTLSKGDGVSSTTVLLAESGVGSITGPQGDSASIGWEDRSDLGAELLGGFADYPSLAALKRFVLDWYVSDIDATDVRTIPGAGPQRRLSPTGDNLANVLEWLAERRPERLEAVLARLREWVPRLESVRPVETGDGRFMLQLKDAPFARAIPARFASEGTLKLLAYLTALLGMDTPTLMAFEEPEDNLPPPLLLPLAEECRIAAGRSQVFVNTHSPLFLDALRPEEVRVLYRDEAGFTRAVRASDVRGVPEAMDEGASLGSLWTQGFLRVGDPTRNAGMPGSGAGS